MKIFLAALLLSLAFAGTSGCTRSAAETGTPAAAILPAARYKAGHGLQLSSEASRFIGLNTAAVSPRDIGAAKAIAAVPAAALLRTINGDFVFVANGGWFLRTPVTVGATDGLWFEVKEGLYEGDTIVTHGTRTLWLAELQAVNGGVGCADGH